MLITAMKPSAAELSYFLLLINALDIIQKGNSDLDRATNIQSDYK
jgi:hypothetical protein